MTMTMQDWLSSRSAGTLLRHLCHNHGAARRKDGRRKLRLFACACCRRVWEKLPEERDREVVLVSERFADERASAEEMAQARQRCQDRAGWIPPAIRAAAATANPQPRAAVKDVLRCVCGAVASHGVGYTERWQAEGAAQADLAREIFGNPFQPVHVEQRWRTANDGAAVRLARTIYDESNFADLPVLADALEEAGCRDEALLAHCRREGGHVRGCWAVDAVLAKD
jgi:hypothetical protein